LALQFTAAPLVLALLGAGFVAACAYFWWVDRRTITDMSWTRRRLALALRIVIVLAIFLSLAGLRFSRTGNSLSVIFLVDASLSMRDDQRAEAEKFVREAISTKRATDTVGVITFAQDPDLKVQPPESAQKAGRSGSGGLQADSAAVKSLAAGLKHRGTRTSTDMAHAMDFALSFIPKGSAGKIVFLGDGNENINSALAAVPTLTARGVKVDTALFPSKLQKEALVEKLVVPPRVKIGEPFVVKVVTNALNAQPGRVSLRRNGQPIGGAKEVDLPKGKRVHSFDVSIDKPGIYRFEADLETQNGDDTIVENNKGMGFVAVRGKPQVLYVSPTPSLVPYLRAGLKDQHIDVAYLTPEALPTTAAAFQQFDSVILSDVPRSDLSIAQMRAIQTSTRDFGVGFGMIGGAQSFGAGGYRNSPIEETLPVTLEVKKQKRYASIGLALVIDRSGSMMDGGGSRMRKLDYAKQAAALTVEFLKSADQVAIVTFTEAAETLVPLVYAGERDRLLGAISKIEPGGGTSVYAGVNEGYLAVRGATSSVKHIIVLTDGMSPDPDYGSLIRSMQREGITVSAILVGAGTGATQGHNLYQVAKATGGRFYSVDTPSDVPKIYLQEVQTISAPPIIEEPFIPSQTPGDDVLQGLGAMPQLLGYNIGEPKPAAGTSLISHRKDPILSTWRYGLGRSMAFMSDDKNKWAVHWLPWSGYGKFWAQ
jgi:Mg-chelatase subunit ChlD